VFHQVTFLSMFVVSRPILFVGATKVVVQAFPKSPRQRSRDGQKYCLALRRDGCAPNGFQWRPDVP